MKKFELKNWLECNQSDENNSIYFICIDLINKHQIVKNFDEK